ncbi:MAG TPA: chemotaxis response regulator protein-glutamate methylesterase [Vicinamibacterales bacterium]|nr:chemotaxis response regulator protein-glutamate methylesterase [Vicinamibacterales bacterium]
MPEIVRVLVVDDSAYVRKVVTEMLGRSPFIEVVAAARDGREALDLTAELNPDVVTCDLNMPQMDGVTYVREQMARRPLPIVIISIADGAGEQVLAALDAGAVDFVQKPTALATERLMDMAEELVEKVKAAAHAPRRAVARGTPLPAIVASPARGRGTYDVVVIGVSTGGPQALKAVIPALPEDFPVPVAMVLHMPLGYTEMYARKLDEMSRLRVVEASAGQLVEPGTVFLAPAGRHLSLRRDGASVRTHLDIRPLDTPHRPSVDALFQSAAEVYGERALGVVMTGMGADGREGAAWIKARGGGILTEAEESCVVYGMPRSVVEAGLSDAAVPLERIAQAIMERV